MPISLSADQGLMTSRVQRCNECAGKQTLWIWMTHHAWERKLPRNSHLLVSKHFDGPNRMLRSCVDSATYR